MVRPHADQKYSELANRKGIVPKMEDKCAPQEGPREGAAPASPGAGPNSPLQAANKHDAPPKAEAPQNSPGSLRDITNAADDANDASVRSQLQTLRSQIELYRAQNPTVNPLGSDSTPVWNNMLDGDYLTTAPVNPLTGSATIGTSPTATTGWVWRLKTLSNGNPGTTYALYGVTVKQHIIFVTDFTDLLDGLYGAYLIVCEHD